jgi:hypothetical protein
VSAGRPASPDAAAGPARPTITTTCRRPERLGGNRACLAVTREFLKRSYHTLRDLGDEPLAPA